MANSFDDNMIGSPDAAWLDSFLDEPAANVDFDMDFFLEGGEDKTFFGVGAPVGDGSLGLSLEEPGAAIGTSAALSTSVPAMDTQKRKIKKKRDRERRAAVEKRKRKRVQMETLMHTTRQLQLQNAQLLRTLGAVQQMAEKNDLEGAARVAAAAGKTAELLPSPNAFESDPDSAAGGSNAIARLFAGAEESAQSLASLPKGGDAHERLAEQRSRIREERMNIVREAIRVLNTGEREKIDAMCQFVHHRHVTLLNPDLSHEIRGLGNIHKYWMHLSEAFPDFTLMLEELSPEDEVGEKIKVRWRFKGTQIEPFLPILPPGRFVELSGNAFVAFKDLKIIRHIWSWNHTELLLSLIGYEKTDAVPSAINWDEKTRVKSEGGPAVAPAPAEAIGAGLAQAPGSGPVAEGTGEGGSSMESRIAETISSMVRSLSAGNLALQGMETTAKKLHKAKSTSELKGAKHDTELAIPHVLGGGAMPGGFLGAMPMAAAAKAFETLAGVDQQI